FGHGRKSIAKNSRSKHCTAISTRFATATTLEPIVRDRPGRPLTLEWNGRFWTTTSGAVATSDIFLAMNVLRKLKTFDRKSGNVNVVVETPKGCRNKYAFDPKLKGYKLKSVLPKGAIFPFDFGFIPGTK